VVGGPGGVEPEDLRAVADQGRRVRQAGEVFVQQWADGTVVKRLSKPQTGQELHSQSLPANWPPRIWFTVSAMHSGEWRSGRFAALLVVGAILTIFIVLLVNR
jgi:hypothetical protein